MSYQKFLEDAVANQTIVQFKQEIEHWDGYFDANMKAIFVGVGNVDEKVAEVAELIFYVRDHDEHNTRVEKCNYWDEHGCATFSARQAGCHPEKHGWKESVYVDINGTLPFNIVDAAYITIMDLDNSEVYKVKGTWEDFKKAYCLKYDLEMDKVEWAILEDGYRYVADPKEVTIEDLLMTNCV